jgi:ribosomal protein S18 acetylase RimI-like enzyme
LKRAITSRGFHLTESCDGSYHAFVPGQETGDSSEFRLSFLPGNRRILISHGVRIPEDRRGKGLGQKYLRMREEIAREAGVNLLLATVREDNPVEKHLLRKHGWEKLIYRRGTGVSLWAKRL